MQEVFENIIINLENEVLKSSGNMTRTYAFEKTIEIVKQAAEGYNNGWIPVKYHVITDKEREEKCISEDIAYYLDCKMPDDGEQIIVTDGENMWSDICFVDICYSLDSGHDWINDIVAWRAMPAKYQPNICTAGDCPINDGNGCPAAEGCAGYQPKGG